MRCGRWRQNGAMATELAWGAGAGGDSDRHVREEEKEEKVKSRDGGLLAGRKWAARGERKRERKRGRSWARPGSSFFSS